jgi:hypothetical protein
MNSDNEQFVQVQPDRRSVASRGRRRHWLLGGGVIAAVALAGTLAGALLTAGSASAASRGFIIRNDSNTALTVVGARGIPRVVCIGFKRVPGNNYPIDFSEGRPPDGDVLTPRSTMLGSSNTASTFSAGSSSRQMWCTGSTARTRPWNTRCLSTLRQTIPSARSSAPRNSLVRPRGATSRSRIVSRPIST